MVDGVGFPFGIETVSIDVVWHRSEEIVGGSEDGVFLDAEVYLGEVEGVKRLLKDEVYVLVWIH